MSSRRDFIKKAALLAGAAAVSGTLPDSVQRAYAIDPEPGTTFLDAEHVVILMQENRSFDHAYGTLQGVRGYNDPRALALPNGNPVWLQTNDAGETYAPFRLDIKGTRATWMGSLPHAWSNQVDARNGGRYDKWLQAKPSGNPDYAHMPLTLGHYTREDIPFYYAFADAFTICDQHFCSSLTGTTPNRLYLWSGTIREKPEPSSPAKVYNEEADFGTEVSWTTFPERLEEHGISWRIYQNEIAVESGFEGEEESWLSNYGDNPIEYFSQFHTYFAAGHRAHLERRVPALVTELAALRQKAASAAPTDADPIRKEIAQKTELLSRTIVERDRWSKENYERLSERDRRLHEKAFGTNAGDPHYRTLEALTYQDGDKERTVQVPKGDVLHQFRRDVDGDTLPTVSWLVGPENFSDHPSAPWYGAWYVSEVLDILTKRPEAWKKTILILTYDENDGYFDHVPPFVAPDPNRPETGRATAGIDTGVDYIDREQDLKARPAYAPRDSAIGLGYRVPLVIASPWSRGGCVCSEVFDHTSVLRFLETYLSHRTGKPVVESNVSPWRRTVCGDLSSAFRPYHGETIALPSFTPRDTVIEGIHRAQFRDLPGGYRALTAPEIAAARGNPAALPLLPRQEPGIRRSAPLPYELYADGALNAAHTGIEFRLAAGNGLFGAASAGAPFLVYAYQGPDRMTTRAYAVAAGGELTDTWALSDFDGGRYHVRIDGPNGFHRDLRGDAAADPQLGVQVRYTDAGRLQLHLRNDGDGPKTIVVRDNSYGAAEIRRRVRSGQSASIGIDTSDSHRWYDFTITIADAPAFAYRYAGRVETGDWGYSDPAMSGTTA